MGIFSKRCKLCEEVIASGQVIALQFCSEECKDIWREFNLKPWQKKFHESVEKWTAKPQ
jgi:predicted nucleic acid-binding Zn ribbon protein